MMNTEEGSEVEQTGRTWDLQRARGDLGGLELS